MRHAASFCVLSLFILGLGVSTVPAEEITVSAQVNQTRIRAAHLLQLSVVVSGPAAGQAPPPDISGLADFEIVSGPSVSSSFRWINGRTASSKSYTYRLRPRRTGLLTIPAHGALKTSISLCW